MQFGAAFMSPKNKTSDQRTQKTLTVVLAVVACVIVGMAMTRTQQASTKNWAATEKVPSEWVRANLEKIHAKCRLMLKELGQEDPAHVMGVLPNIFSKNLVVSETDENGNSRSVKLTRERAEKLWRELSDEYRATKNTRSFVKRDDDSKLLLVLSNNAAFTIDNTESQCRIDHGFLPTKKGEMNPLLAGVEDDEEENNWITLNPDDACTCDKACGCVQYYCTRNGQTCRNGDDKSCPTGWDPTYRHCSGKRSTTRCRVSDKCGDGQKDCTPCGRFHCRDAPRGLYCTRFPGFKINGFDIKHADKNSVNECEDFCTRTPNCLAYSYSQTSLFQNGLGKSSSICYLKTGLNAGALSAGHGLMISGVCSGRSCTKNDRWNHKNLKDHDISSWQAIYTNSFDQCKALCRYNSQCKAFTRNVQTKKCYLKHGNGGLEDNQVDESGLCRD